jgi:hypothetical protein
MATNLSTISPFGIDGNTLMKYLDIDGIEIHMHMIILPL